MIDPKSPVVDEAGLPLWRMAPSPHGAYWEEGQKLGYQDAGAWTFLKSTPLERRKAAWLYAQFVVSKTVSLKKTLVGLTPIRDSDLRSTAMTEAAPRLGGLVEFYRSPARTAWTPTGTNVPDYPKLAQLWWPNVANAVSGAVTAQQAMDTLAAAQDRVLERLQRAEIQGECGPRLNDEVDPQMWLAQPGAPKPKLDDEKPPGMTVAYDELIAEWREASL
jgi:glycerol transport system substrate-binding protein